MKYLLIILAFGVTLFAIGCELAPTPEWIFWNR